MKKFCFSICFQKCGVQVLVTQKPDAFILLQKLMEEGSFEFENGTLIGDGMNVCNRVFISWFGNQDATIIGIQRVPENVEKKISFSDKAYAKGFTVFGLGFATVCTLTFKIEDSIKIRFIQCVDSSIHEISDNPDYECFILNV